MTVSQIYKAWGILLTLSLATTGLTVVPTHFRTLTAGLLLALSGWKARAILAQYLELHHSPFWMRLFGTTIWMFLLIAFGLYAAGSGRMP